MYLRAASLRPSGSPTTSGPPLSAAAAEGTGGAPIVQIDLAGGAPQYRVAAPSSDKTAKVLDGASAPYSAFAAYKKKIYLPHLDERVLSIHAHAIRLPVKKRRVSGESAWLAARGRMFVKLPKGSQPPFLVSGVEVAFFPECAACRCVGEFPPRRRSCFGSKMYAYVCSRAKLAHFGDARSAMLSQALIDMEFSNLTREVPPGVQPLPLCEGAFFGSPWQSVCPGCEYAGVRVLQRPEGGSLAEVLVRRCEDCASAA